MTRLGLAPILTRGLFWWLATADSAHLIHEKQPATASRAKGARGLGMCPSKKGGLTWQADAPQERLKLIEFQPFLWRWANYSGDFLGFKKIQSIEYN